MATPPSQLSGDDAGFMAMLVQAAALTSQVSLAPSVLAPSFASEDATEAPPPVHFPTPVEQATEAVQTILEISITQLALSYEIWHMLVIYAGDLFLLYVFCEVGGAFLETGNSMLCAQLATDALSVIYLAYKNFQDALPEAFRVYPENEFQSNSPALLKLVLGRLQSFRAKMRREGESLTGLRYTATSATKDRTRGFRVFVPEVPGVPVSRATIRRRITRLITNARFAHKEHASNEDVIEETFLTRLLLKLICKTCYQGSTSVKAESRSFVFGIQEFMQKFGLEEDNVFTRTVPQEMQVLGLTIFRALLDANSTGTYKTTVISGNNYSTIGRIYHNGIIRKAQENPAWADNREAEIAASVSRFMQGEWA